MTNTPTTITDSKIINLSSNSATTSNGSKNSIMMFNLNSILKYEKDIVYNLISMVHCSIPASYYVVNDTNNFLSTDIGDFTFINGNYNANSFSIMFQQILGVGWILILNSITGKFTLSYTSNFIINASSTCFKIMGFISNTIYSSINNSLTFPNPCNFLGISRLKLKSNIIQTNNLDTYSKGKSNLLSSIPVNNAQNGLIVYTNQVNFKSLFPNQSLDYIDISITDESDNVVDFNGIDIYITLQIDTIRSNLPQDNSLSNLLEREKN